MTHYSLNPPRPREPVMHRQRWETLAAFLAFGALVALAGATYGSLRKSDVYTEVRNHASLEQFAGILESSPRLRAELADKRRHFTIIAPSDMAFRLHGVEFPADEAQTHVTDRSIVRIGGEHYILQGEGYVVRSHVQPYDVPFDDVLQLPAANGELVTMQRNAPSDRAVITVNGVPVRDRILADNGVIYVIDSLIHPLPQNGAESPEEVRRSSR